MYKEAILNKYSGSKLFKAKIVDNSLCGDSLIAMEYKPHWKHKTNKDLVYAHIPLHNINKLPNNKFESELFLNYMSSCSMSEFKDIEYKSNSGKWLRDWLLKQTKYLHLMDLVIFKNVAISLYNDNVDIYDYINNIKIFTNKHNIKSELMGWYNWAKHNNKKHFNKREITEFFNLHNLRMK
jgi:hypothetical protein